jgi:HAD superfamily hydrolase (TIGR01484 family)
MRSIDTLDQGTARKLRGVLFDLDDTLFDHSRLTEVAYAALHRLSESDLTLLAVTGRPVGFGEVLVPAWPIAGLVAENGAIAVMNVEGKTQLFDEVSADVRAARRERLLALAAEMRRWFPELFSAADVHLRRCDFTFDIGEYRTVADALVLQAAAFARSMHAATARSSVHLHISFDGCDKASGALRILSRCLGYDATLARALFAFIGDSENDEAGFAAFHTSVAVANLRGRPTVSPQFITRNPRGRGFAEFAQKLVALRK